MSGFTSCCLAPCLLVEEPLSGTCRTVILRVLSILDAAGWNCFVNLSCSSVSVILFFLSGASVPADQVLLSSFFGVLIDLIVELLGLIIKPFDNQTES